MKKSPILLPAYIFVVFGLVSACQTRDLTLNEIEVAATGQPGLTISEALKQAEARLPSAGDTLTLALAAGSHSLSETLSIGLSPKGIIRLMGSEGTSINSYKAVEGWQEEDGGIWSAPLPQGYLKPYVNVRQLMKNGQRLQRARTPNQGWYFTLGPAQEHLDSVGVWNFPLNSYHQRHNPLINTWFQFAPGAISQAETPAWREVHMLHSWESSWSSFHKIDEDKNQAQVLTPFVWPVGFFGSHGDSLRYALYGAAADLDAAGEWYANPETERVYYMAEAGENPNEQLFQLPSLVQLLDLDGASNIVFENIEFKGTACKTDTVVSDVHYTLDIPYSPDWTAHAQSFQQDWPSEYYHGYSDPQGALYVGDAVRIANSENIQFRSCTFSQLGGYAIFATTGSSKIAVENCRFDQLGAGALRLGVSLTHVDKAGYAQESALSGVMVKANHISHTGQLFPGSVGIWIAQAQHVEIEGNLIEHLPYTGISLGWTWSKEPNFTRNNRIVGNEIRNAVNLLTDGGGIYTLGNLEGTEIVGNYIHHVLRPGNAAGSHSNGIFFDEASNGARVAGNWFHDISNSPIRFNASSAAWFSFEDNYFDVEHLLVKPDANFNTDFNEEGLAELVLEGNHFGVAVSQVPDSLKLAPIPD